MTTLELLLDERDITRLLYDFAAAYDSADWVRAASFFAQGVWHLSPDASLNGEDEVRTFLEQNVTLYDGKPLTRHMFSGIRIDVSSDRASATAHAYVTVLQSLPGEGPVVLLQAAYEDTFQRGTHGWRFAARTAVVDGAGNVATHLGGPLATS